jgi:hypothetical protein
MLPLDGSKRMKYVINYITAISNIDGSNGKNDHN